MTRRPRCPGTLDLLSWTPPVTSVRFAEEEVRAASLATQFCRAMTLAIKDSGKSRDEIAAEMSVYLGEDVSVAMLNAYTSEARESHTINVVRFLALIHATGDMRLLSLLTAPFDHVAMPVKFERLARAFMLREQVQAAAEAAEAEMRLAKRECGV